MNFIQFTHALVKYV